MDLNRVYHDVLRGESNNKEYDKVRGDYEDGTQQSSDSICSSQRPGLIREPFGSRCPQWVCVKHTRSGVSRS